MPAITRIASNVALLALACTPLAQAQHRSGLGAPPARPRLVVGITVDQMRYDFLYRYWACYGKGGIKRLVQKGYSFEQAHYPYAPTVTGPGHASLFTGTSPAYHGIAGNHWWVRQAGAETYCTADSTVQGLGAKGEAGQMSPRNLLTTTIGDELKFATRGQGKVIGVALKDRGSILPAGHRADAAYWFDTKSGNWISSNYYMSTLPDWVSSFNTQKSAGNYLQQPWAPLLPAEAYNHLAGPDSSLYEGQVTAGAGTRMPVDIPRFVPRAGYGLLYNSGLGIHVTTDFALAALSQEQLGKRAGTTDMLCLSYSSTDVVGHIFGPDSWEVMDTYLRLDRDLERLLDAIDDQVGLKNVLVFLSADHGVVQVPDLAASQKLPAGRYAQNQARQAAEARLAERYGAGTYVLAEQGEQLYLNRPYLKERRISVDEAAAVAAEAVRALPWCQNAWGAWALKAAAVTDPFARRLALGAHPERSGDVYFLPRPGFIESERSRGTTHGTPYSYDTHVPMLFFGWGVPKGQSRQAVSITDIAPTVSSLLKMMEPSGCIGQARSFEVED